MAARWSIRAEEARGARFQARMDDAEDRIEPNDWMPEGYRRTLTPRSRSTPIPRSSGMLPEGNWITRAPSLKRKAALLAKSRTRPATASTCTRRPRPSAPAARSCSSNCSPPGQIFLDLQLSDADLGDIGRSAGLVDGAAIMNQIPLCRCSYGPYARR